MNTAFELFLNTFGIILPLFLVIAGGWGMSAVLPFDEQSLTRILVDFFMPLLVFVSLYDSAVSPEAMGELLAAVIFLVFSLYLVVFLYGRGAKRDIRGVALPVIFMNSGFIGFPLMQLWGGNEAMSIIIVFDQIYTFFLLTLGFLIIGGGFTLRGLMLSVKSPILWAAGLGFLFNIARIPLPGALLDSFRFAGAVAPPLAAFIVGASLAGGRPRVDTPVLIGIVLRVVVGFSLGIAAVWLFHLEGITRTVVLVSSALPSAVFSYILPARYGVDASEARSIVVLSTVLCVITIPLSFALASLF